MTRLQLDQLLKDLSTKNQQIKKLLVEACEILSQASLNSYMDSRSDGFIERIVPKIRDHTGVRGIYESNDGNMYRVHIVKIKSMNENDRELLLESKRL